MNVRMRRTRFLERSRPNAPNETAVDLTMMLPPTHVKPPDSIAHSVLCADDFGLTRGVSLAISELAEQSRLSASSVMTNLPAWPSVSAALPSLRRKIAVGLHLNLTTGEPVSDLRHELADGEFQSLGQTIMSSMMMRWNQRLLKQEIMAQCERFEQAAGAPPDHVDGHQHVHVLPVIRRTLLSCLKERYPGVPILIRDPTPGLGQIRAQPDSRSKAMLIQLLSARLRVQAKASGFIVNDTFAGFSSFTEGKPFDVELDQALESGRGLHLVMCHPGHVDDDIARHDVVVQRREEERAAMMDMPLEHRIWHPERTATDQIVSWPLSATFLPGE